MSRRRRGLSLLEVTIAGALLAGLLAVSLDLVGRAQPGVADGLRRADLATRSRAAGRLIERTFGNLQGASVQLGGRSPVTGRYTAVRARLVEGYDVEAQTPTIGPLTELRFELGGGETWNGRDDDGDGLTDEGQLVLYRDADEDGILTAAGRVTALVADVEAAGLGWELPSGEETPTAADRELLLSLPMAVVRPGAYHVRLDQLRIPFRN